MPVGQPASEGSEKHEGCNQEKGDRVDKPARLAGGKKPLHEANQDEFCRILVEGPPAPANGQPPKRGHRNRVLIGAKDAERSEIYIIDKA